MKFQLSDIAFLILAKIDSVDRLENTLMIVEYLSSRYDTEIHVWEYGVYDNCILSRLLPAGVAYAFHEEFDLTFIEHGTSTKWYKRLPNHLWLFGMLMYWCLLHK